MRLRELARGEHARAAALLASGFRDDPGACLLYPDPQSRARALTTWFRVLLLSATHCDAAFAPDGELAAAGVWLRPAEPSPRGAPLPRLRLHLELLRHPRALLRMSLAAPALVRLETRTRPRRSTVLLAIATDPERRARGYGSTLLRHGLERLEAAGEPCYLETTREENLDFYRRRGFRVAGSAPAPGALRTWALVRAPGG